MAARPGRRCCPLAHDCRYCCNWCVGGVRAYCKRRRNSYKLFLFYSAAAFLESLLFGVALVFYNIIWQNIKTIHMHCRIDSPPGTESDLINLISQGNQAVMCPGETTQSACELADMRIVVDAILVNGVVGFLQTMMCFIMSLSFRLFTNLPAERLQYDKATRCTTCVGGICKHGPWLTKFLHLVKGGVLLVYWLVVLSNYCRGDLAKTYDCANYKTGCGGTSGSCAYNKLRNCQYYYIHCRPWPRVDSAKLVQCFDTSGRLPFSGCMDVRLLTHDNCTRCEILRSDLARDNREDEFYMADPTPSELQSHACRGAAQLHCLETRVRRRHCKCEDFIFPTCNASMNAPSPMQARLAVPAAQSDTPPQPCGWAPSAPLAYSMDERHCSQHGSFVYKFSIVYIYVAGGCWALLTLAGQALRTRSKVEPWFFNPRAPHEGFCWRLLRLAGP